MEFTEDDKYQMMREILGYIEEHDITYYHGLMDEICENKKEWFNMLMHDRKKKLVILEYIKSRARGKYLTN